MRLNNVNRRCCAAACRRTPHPHPPSSSTGSICTETQSVCAGAGAARDAIFSKPRICQTSTSCAAHCAFAALSLCSHSFVCLMTSLRGLLALDTRSQNGRTFPRKSCIQKELHLRYMIGNFCHDSLVINIKIDTTDAAQNKKMCTPSSWLGLSPQSAGGSLESLYLLPEYLKSIRLSEERYAPDGRLKQDPSLLSIFR